MNLRVGRAKVDTDSFVRHCLDISSFVDGAGERVDLKPRANSMLSLAIVACADK
jgi:hypothetical protein